MMRDECTRFSVVRAISPVVATDDTPIVSEVVDVGINNSLTFYLATGSLADANATFTVLVEHSDASGSGFAAVDDVHLVGTEAAASFTFDDDNEVRKIGYVGVKRYVKLTVTPTGNTGNAAISCVAVLGASRRS